ncbi:MAG: tRNA 2-thiocytidine(32) synthetase TtcA [Spirochaeta sp. LUC14_002_19_P3]|nr:MAG: tRNA 2-thiocytidine(32) synthetase TtcA [Spirochaeta sp. LUC14_002_19_P3]
MDDVKHKRLEKKINHAMGKALAEWNMIAAGDRILIAVSGGKDSLALLHFIKMFQKKAPVPFEYAAVNIDQKHPEFPRDVLPGLFEEWRVPYFIQEFDSYSIVKSKVREGDIPCALCSRLRRGQLHAAARENGFNKVALGHHKDDIVQTFLLNLFFSGQLSTMPPRYQPEKENLEIIRPLCNVEEAWIEEYAALRGWPLIPCSYCGSQPDRKRRQMQQLLNDLQTRYPDIKNSIFAALHNPHPGMLYSRALWKGEVPRVGDYPVGRYAP